MKKLSLLFIVLFLVSCAGMTPKAKLQTAHLVVGSSLEMIYINAKAICEVQIEIPPECSELDGIYGDVIELHESIGVSANKIIDIKEKLDNIE